MKRLVLPTVIALALAASLTAGAIPPRKPPTLGIMAGPTLVYLNGSQRGTIKVTNTARKPVTLAVSTGNYTVGSDGRVRVATRIPKNRTAKAWLAVSPKKLHLAAGASTYVSVTAHPPAHAEAGDHNALVFLSATGKKGQVGIVTRLGIGVLVRMPGTIQRKLSVAGVSVVRRAKTRSIRIALRNGGNINERVPKGHLTVTLERGGRTLKTLRAPFVELLPRMRVHATIHYRGKLRGRVTALVRLRPTSSTDSGPRAPLLPPLQRTFVLHL